MWININVDHLKETLLSCNEIEAAYLFGSAARREPVVNDIDLLILADSNENTHHLYFNLLHRIANDHNIPESQIDILFFDIYLADPYILDRAINTGILLCNRNEKLLTELPVF